MDANAAVGRRSGHVFETEVSAISVAGDSTRVHIAVSQGLDVLI